MKFKPNKMRYGQDHRQHVGIPAGVEFVVERFGTSMFCLTGDGYGRRDNYGNGKLYVWGLTAKQRRRFEEACVPHSTDPTEQKSVQVGFSV